METAVGISVASDDDTLLGNTIITTHTRLFSSCLSQFMYF